MKSDWTPGETFTGKTTNIIAVCSLDMIFTGAIICHQQLKNNCSFEKKNNNNK
jgi:hypothetical protein